MLCGWALDTGGLCALSLYLALAPWLATSQPGLLRKRPAGRAAACHVLLWLARSLGFVPARALAKWGCLQGFFCHPWLCVTTVCPAQGIPKSPAMLALRRFTRVWAWLLIHLSCYPAGDISQVPWRTVLWFKRWDAILMAAHLWSWGRRCWPHGAGMTLLTSCPWIGSGQSPLCGRGCVGPALRAERGDKWGLPFMFMGVGL